MNMVYGIKQGLIGIGDRTDLLEKKISGEIGHWLTYLGEATVRAMGSDRRAGKKGVAWRVNTHFVAEFSALRHGPNGHHRCLAD